MKFSKILLTVLAGTALVMVAKSIRKRQVGTEGYFYDAYPDVDLSEDEDFHHHYPDNPVHGKEDTDHPMFI